MPDSAIHRGHEAVMRDWQRTFASFDEFSVEAEDIRDLGTTSSFSSAGRVSVVGGRVLVEALGAHLLTVMEGKLVRMRQFLDRDRALKAAGLSE